MDPLFPAVPEFSELTLEDLAAFITENGEAIDAVGSDPRSFVVAPDPENDQPGRTGKQLLAEMEAAVAAQEAAQEAYTKKKAAEDEEADKEDEPDEDEFAALAARAQAASTIEPPATAEAETVETAAVELETAAVEPEPAPALEPEVVQTAELEETVTASTTPPATRHPRPARSQRATPQTVEAMAERISLVAAASGLGNDLGREVDVMEIARMMISRRAQFGNSIPKGTEGEKYPIARADWSDLYPPERTLGLDPIENMELIAAATDPVEMGRELRRRREGKSLQASGGLCAPVTPYYGLEMVSTASRPVRAALPAFTASRGGIRYASPIATLASIGDAIGVITAADDAAGGTFATKSCQRIECPDFVEKVLAAIYHCLEVGNFTARTFPELVAQWEGLTMAGHARLAETRLLTTIDGYSTEVTAGNMGLGASASLFGQYLAAANGYRNRHRTVADAPLRLLVPFWIVDLIISDVIRTQFERFDTDAARVMALFRQYGIEPTFYIDGALDRNQVFGTQDPGDLLPFPDHVVGYMYAEGAFLYLDGGTLELGLVRDSVLNLTNDYQLFGETFEELAGPFGVEALAIVSEVCDSGAVSLPVTVACPADYAPTFAT